jgi:hypothetical protein
MIHFGLRCYFLAVRYRLQIRYHASLLDGERLCLYLVGVCLLVFAVQVGSGGYAYYCR